MEQQKAFSIDAGLSFFPNSDFRMGFYLNNLTTEKYKTLSLSSGIPTTFHGGIAYTFSDRITIGSNLNYDNGALTQTLGIEYRIGNTLSIRGGLSSRPLEKYLGFGIILQKMIIDIVVTRTPFFTYTPQIGLSYAF
jgi:hypothetical protein